MSRTVGLWMIAAPAEMFSVLLDVTRERLAQDEKWGEQNHPDVIGAIPSGDPAVDAAKVARVRSNFAAQRDKLQAQVDLQTASNASDWAAILLEEVYEALAESDPANIRAELVQVAAVAVQWIEAIDRRQGVTL